MGDTMSKVLCYIYEGMADFEISLLLHRLSNVGKKQIVTISESLKSITAQSGMKFLPDQKISDPINLEEFSALIIPGGPINENQNEICSTIIEMIQMKKLVAAICFGPQFLGRAGILNHYKYTTSCKEDKILELGCKDPFNRSNYIEERVVICDNLITAKGYAFLDFAYEICKYLNIYDDEMLQLEEFGQHNFYYSTMNQGFEDSNDLKNILSQEKLTLGKKDTSDDLLKSEFRSIQEKINKVVNENIVYKKRILEQKTLLIQNQRSLYELNKFKDSILKVIPMLILIVSKDGILLECYGDKEILFFEEEDIINKHILDIIPDHDIGLESMRKLQRATFTGDVQELECYFDVSSKVEYYTMKLIDFTSNRVLVSAQRTTEVYQYQNQIELLKYTDQVTGLYNRIYFDEKIVELSKTNRYPLCVIVSDVNGLKLINNSFGYEVGDILLKKYADILKKLNINSEYISRVGGDEFIILLPKSEIEVAQKMVAYLKDECERVEVNGITLSVSFGIGCQESGEHLIEDIINRAEDEMCQNKLYDAPGRRDRTISLIVSTLQEKNPREQLHSDRVAELCEKLAEKLGLSKMHQSKIRSAGLLHDIGKIGISEELLNKPGKLTLEEYETICTHPEIGYRILKSAGNMNDISELIYAHHERWDGEGYPRKLKGEEIPLESRMLAIADTYDAMTSDRSYRKGMGKEEAIKELLRCSGTQFDPQLVPFFVQIL